MSPRLKFGVVFFSTVLTLMLVLGAVTGASKEKDEGAYRPLRVYTEVLARIKSDYVEEPDMTKVTRGALQGLVEYLDPLSSYLTAEQYEKFQKSQSNEDKGTGLSTGLIVHKRSSYTRVLGVLPGSAADKAGIRAGDFVEALDGLSTRAMPPAYLHGMLSGAPGTSVNVLVRPFAQPDQPQEHRLVRGKLELPPVQHKMIEDDIGYIDMDLCDTERVNQVANAIKALEAGGAKKLILDLRENSVGDPAEGARLANYFLDGGAIATLKGQRHPEEAFRADAESTLTRLPLVVIVDWATSGGAEIAAAAILDAKRGEVTGEGTYGLAAKQKTIPLDDGAALVLSVAKYHRPSGKAVQDGGIEPSVPLSPAELRRYRQAEFDLEEGPEAAPPDPGAGATSGEDPFLKKAIEVLKGEVTAQREAA